MSARRNSRTGHPCPEDEFAKLHSLNAHNPWTILKNWKFSQPTCLPIFKHITHPLALVIVDFGIAFATKLSAFFADFDLFSKTWFLPVKTKPSCFTLNINILQGKRWQKYKVITSGENNNDELISYRNPWPIPNILSFVCFTPYEKLFQKLVASVSIEIPKPRKQ